MVVTGFPWRPDDLFHLLGRADLLLRSDLVPALGLLGAHVGGSVLLTVLGILTVRYVAGA
jgi:hypothetical protein